MSQAEYLSRRDFLAAALAVAGLSGCAPFKTPDDLQSKLLPKPRLAPDSVILEIGYAQVPLVDSATYDEVWKLADEQSLALELRQELERNGLRFGILGKQIPEKVRAIMDSQRQDLDSRSEDLNVGEVQVDRQTRRLQCRAARRAMILCSKRYDQLSLLMRENGAVRGRQLQQAQCLFGLKPYPHGDGRVKIDLLPEVEHGEMQRQWVGGEGSLMQRVGRDKVTFEAMRVSLSLAPGQMIVASATAPPKGLGENFFVEPVAGIPSRSLLFIRLAHTQQDNLFAPELSAPALATPGD
ncbi:twin-arginine translocation signal domain-containing protein [Anatilimnocola floriformis]|uniref:twin-arginine translocation signal domain-containing protein n=1 Tax=Anatilimnocola floriformis TaxID=2948575 RepID=UPI0020C22C97|nr:twin-arginine translocation signal domain-containing protein [Anatilimnocola floriformis]